MRLDDAIAAVDAGFMDEMRPTDASQNRVRVAGADNRIEIDPSVRMDAAIHVEGANNVLIVEADALLHEPTRADGVLVEVRGSGNRVRLGAGLRLGGVVTIHADNAVVEMGARGKIFGYFNVLSDAAVLRIGEDVSMVQASVQLHEPGEIRFGRDCMVSTQVYVSLSDIHPIYDRRSGERINPARSVVIGEHVWLGLRSMVLKGAEIGDGAVVAAGAMVTGAVPAHAIVAGAPARVLRTDVVWRRDFSEPPPEPTEPAIADQSFFHRLRKRLW